MKSDWKLLSRYAKEGSHDDFAELVNRHVNLVYSAARRQVLSRQLAEEVTQSVFTDLARSAVRLKPDTILTAWLYQVARRTAVDVIRKETRRHLREQIAMEMETMQASATEWRQIEPILDEAMEALEETDRTAILLRYFENRNLREVGERLGISDDAAQKRVSRAVERLREFFDKRKATIGASGLMVLISTNAVQSAPVGLAANVVATAITGTAISTGGLITSTKMITMTTLKKAAITAVIAGTVGLGVFETHQATLLQTQNQILQQQEAPMVAQINQLQRELNEATNQMAALTAQTESRQSNSNWMELLKLRGEMARLREENRQLSDTTNSLRASMIRSWLAREDQLKQIAQTYTDKAIPEFQLLSEQEWLDAAMHASFDNSTNIQQDLASLRRQAENDFATQAQDALRKYLNDNNQFPTNVAQLQPYFSSPMAADIMVRWKVAPASENPSVGVGDTIITEVAPIDASMDSQWAIGANGYGSGSYRIK